MKPITCAVTLTGDARRDAREIKEAEKRIERVAVERGGKAVNRQEEKRGDVLTIRYFLRERRK